MPTRPCEDVLGQLDQEVKRAPQAYREETGQEPPPAWAALDLARKAEELRTELSIDD